MFCTDDEGRNGLYPSEQPSRGFAGEPQQSAFEKRILHRHVASRGAKVLMKMTGGVSPEDITSILLTLFILLKINLSNYFLHHRLPRVTYLTRDFFLFP